MSRWTRPAWAALLIYMQALQLAFRVGVSTLKQPQRPMWSKTLVTWSKRNSAATLFMASWSKVLHNRSHTLEVSYARCEEPDRRG